MRKAKNSVLAWTKSITDLDDINTDYKHSFKTQSFNLNFKHLTWMFQIDAGMKQKIS